MSTRCATAMATKPSGPALVASQRAFAESLRAARIRQELSLRELSEIAGVDQAMRIEASCARSLRPTVRKVQTREIGTSRFWRESGSERQ